LYICHKSKREILIIKLDFEKSFDKVEHQVILEMFRRKGFSDKWVLDSFDPQLGLLFSSLKWGPWDTFQMQERGQVGRSPLL
jgi:hypothetical protein